MTNTDTADADGTAIQVARLAHAGSQLVRVTVNTDEAAAAVPEMVRKVRGLGVDVPIIGDFHYNGHKLLAEYPEMAAALAKYRINPGNVGAKRHDEHFATIVRIAIDNGEAGPDRGQLGFARPGDPDRADGRERRARRAARRARRDDRGDARVGDALGRAGRGDRACAHDRIILSAKVSGVRDLVDVYRLLAARSDYPLHLGLTEAGMGDKGIVASTAGLAILLNEGIGDTIRVSLTPEPGRAARTRGRDRPAGAPVDGPALVPAAGLGLPGLRPDDLDVLPGDGPADPGLPQGADADLARDAPGRRGAARRGHGLRRQRPGRVEARRHRDQPARARSRSRSRRSSSTAASIARCVATASWREFIDDPRGLRRAPVPVAGRARSPTADPRTSASDLARELPPASGRAPFEPSTLRVYTSAATERPLRTWVTPTFLFERRR